jgi:multiple sugar transport system ATP-binding protein
MAEVAFRNLGKVYPDGTAVLHALDLEIADGELLVLVGPSGCGKSTLLRMVAGLEEISEGEIRIGGRRVNQWPPQRRNVAMVFQNYALYPHMTVRRNLAFPLRMQGLPRREIERRVAATADLLDLTDLLERQPRALSGGQRQRVAMGRALVREPAVFLMDEPLSNLDARLRLQIRTEIAALQRRLGVTTLYVTHDQVEAMTLGDRVAVLHGGRLQQVATPGELYARPANAFVAGFIGSPGMNLFSATLARDGTDFVLETGPLRLPLAARQVPDLPAGAPLLAGLRPEALSLQGTGPRIRGRVQAAESLGHETILYCETELRLPATVQGAAPAQPEAGVRLAAVLPGQQALRPGERVELVADGLQLYFFTAEGQAL